MQRHLPLHDHLRRDAGVIGARDPERIFAAQPLIADENILQRDIQRVANVQRAGHVRRRHDDGVRRRVRARRAERVGALPMRIPAGFDFGRVECFVEFGHGPALNEGRAQCQVLR